MSKARDVKGNGCQRQWDVKVKRCQSKGMSEQRDVRARLSKQRDVRARLSKQRDVRAKGCQSKAVKAKRCQSKGMSKQRASFSHPRLARKRRFHILTCWILKEVSHKSFVFTILTCCILKDVSHKSFVFTILTCWNLKDVSHEMRFCEITDARNVLYCRTKRVSDDVWGSLSGGRLRNTLA